MPTELPFDFFCDFLRQTWDEVRHSRMGFERLQALGIDPYAVAIPMGHYAVWGNMHLRDRIASLTQVGEACSFKGKREWVAAPTSAGSGSPRSSTTTTWWTRRTTSASAPAGCRRSSTGWRTRARPRRWCRTPDWTFRRRINAAKRDLGEAWKEVLGNRFLGCGTQTSDVTLAPEIIA